MNELEKPLTHLTAQELEDALTVHTKRGTVFFYNDILAELNRRTQMEHSAAMIELTKQTVAYTRWMAFTAIISTVIALFALLGSLYNLTWLAAHQNKGPSVTLKK